MRCARCDFENIPGQSRCIRCGSILETGGAVTEVHPPRMPAWAKPFRDATRRLRRVHLVPQRSLTRFVGPRFDAVMSDCMAGLALGIIPGLAHLLSGRFKEVRLLVALWFALVGTGLFLYGTQIGSLLIALAIGVHAWIAVRYNLFDKIGGFGERVGAALLIVALLTALYWLAPRMPGVGIGGGYTSLTIPAMNVHTGDYLLVRHIAGSNTRLARGTLVLIRPRGLRNARPDRQINPNRRMVGQIAGLPGETIWVGGGGPYAVGETLLDPNAIPVPQWLSRVRRMSIFVPRDSYFVSSEYTVRRRGNQAVTDDMVRTTCVVEASAIRGRAFMCWWPLSRRHFLRQEQ